MDFGTEESTTGRFEECVFLINVTLLTVGSHETKCCHPFIELPSEDSRHNEKNYLRIWWLAARTLAALHMMWYKPERWQKWGSRRIGLGLFTICLEGYCRIWSCREEEETRRAGWFSKAVCSSLKNGVPVQEARKRSEQAYRNELRDPDKESIQLVLVPQKYRHTALVWRDGAKKASIHVEFNLARRSTERTSI